MKKSIIAIGVLFLVSLSSCCKKCTHSSWPGVTVCRDDYDSDTDYQNAISSLEWAGYTCQ